MESYREREDFLHQINRLQIEVQNSTSLYEKYRERARSSLTKASQEQVLAEKKYKEIVALVKVRIIQFYFAHRCIFILVFILDYMYVFSITGFRKKSY